MRITPEVKEFIEKYKFLIKDREFDELFHICSSNIFAEVYDMLVASGIEFEYTDEFYTMCSQGYQDHYSNCKTYEEAKNKALSIAGNKHVEVSVNVKNKKGALWSIIEISNYNKSDPSRWFKIAKCSDGKEYKLNYDYDTTSRYSYQKYSGYENIN